MIRESIKLLERIRDDFGQTEIIVGVSGQKDSLTTLDLCARVFERVHGFFIYFVKGLECEERFLRLAEKRYDTTIHRLPSTALADTIRYSRLRKCTPELESLVHRDLRWNDIERIMRSRTGAEWVACGHRVTDSLQRRAMIQRSAGVLEKSRRCYPIWNWAPCDVFSFLRSRKIPVPPMFGSDKHKSSGLSPFDVDCLLFLRKEFPRDYRKVLRVFPGAELLIERNESRAKYAIEYNA